MQYPTAKSEHKQAEVIIRTDESIHNSPYVRSSYIDLLTFPPSFPPLASFIAIHGLLYVALPCLLNYMV